jgi:hypothetical protein
MEPEGHTRKRIDMKLIQLHIWRLFRVSPFCERYTQENDKTMKTEKPIKRRMRVFNMTTWMLLPRTAT